MPKETFSGRLTEQRKNKKISQKQAAKDLGISQALLSHYENGVRECGLSFVVKAANYYGVSCDYLLGNSNNAVKIEEIPQISDIPEDKSMSADTIIRAILILGQRTSKDEETVEFFTSVFGLAAYFLLFAGVKKGVLPQDWLKQEAMNWKRINFLAMKIGEKVNEIVPNSKKASKEKIPDCVSTVSSWANDYLNVSIADLL